MSKLKTKILIDIGKYNHLVEQEESKSNAENIEGEGLTKEGEDIKNSLQYQKDLLDSKEGLITSPIPPQKSLVAPTSFNDLSGGNGANSEKEEEEREEAKSNTEKDLGEEEEEVEEGGWDVSSLSDEHIKALLEKVIKRYLNKAFKLIKSLPKGVLFCGKKYQLHMPDSKDIDLRIIFAKIFSRANYDTSGPGVKYVLDLVERHNLQKFLPPKHAHLKSRRATVENNANIDEKWYFLGE